MFTRETFSELDYLVKKHYFASMNNKEENSRILAKSLVSTKTLENLIYFLFYNYYIIYVIQEQSYAVFERVTIQFHPEAKENIRKNIHIKNNLCYIFLLQLWHQDIEFFFHI